MTTQAKSIPVLVTRTQMCGGGNAYDVLLPVDHKAYKPITGHCYATIICWQGGQYYRLSDFLRTPALDALPSFTEERFDTFHRLGKVAERFEAIIAARAFPELSGRTKLPFLWSSTNMESADRVVSVKIRDRDGKAVA
jgi:hypothetical protein